MIRYSLEQQHTDSIYSEQDKIKSRGSSVWWMITHLLRANKIHAKLIHTNCYKRGESSAPTTTHTPLVSSETVQRSAFQHKTDWSGGQGKSMVRSPRLGCMLTHEADPGCAVCTNLLWASLEQITATKLQHTLPPVPWLPANTFTASAGVSSSDPPPPSLKLSLIVFRFSVSIPLTVFSSSTFILA